MSDHKDAQRCILGNKLQELGAEEASPANTAAMLLALDELRALLKGAGDESK